MSKDAVKATHHQGTLDLNTINSHEISRVISKKTAMKAERFKCFRVQLNSLSPKEPRSSLMITLVNLSDLVLEGIQITVHFKV